jgi:hypothetical protein
MHFDTFQPIHMHSKTLPNPRLVWFHTSDTRKDTHELDEVQSIWNRSFVCWVLRWVEKLALGFCRYETMGCFQDGIGDHGWKQWIGTVAGKIGLHSVRNLAQL